MKQKLNFSAAIKFGLIFSEIARLKKEAGNDRKKVILQEAIELDRRS
jgi:hypothetical protein